MPYADLSTVRMHYCEAGQGPERVLLVHGFQASGRIWQPVQQRLPARLHSIAVNNRGAGETTAPADESQYGCKPFADDLYELVDSLAWEAFTLVGHSMGGATAMQFAVDHPDRLKGLVLLDPAPPDGLLEAGADVDAAIEQRILAREAQRAAGARSSELDGSNLPGEFVRALAADIDAAPEQRLRGSYRSMATLRLGERVATLAMPVLLMGGDQDQLVPLQSMLNTYARLPAGSGLQIWHGAGHSPNLSDPAAVCNVLVHFIEHTIPTHKALAGRHS
ncbi:MAG: alpha/beta fold hydrolase [Dehalococcoidia bacterium]